MIRDGVRHNWPVMTLCAVPALSVSADWSVQPTAQLFAQVESNPLLLLGNASSAQAGVAELALNLRRRTELFDVTADARGSMRRYTGNTGLDRDEQQLDLQLQRRGERYTLLATATATRDTTLTSELGTTGFTQENQRHNALSASLSPTWQVTERTTTGASLGWQQSRYAQTSLSLLVDYDYRSVGLNAAHDLNEKGSIGLQASAGRMTSEGNNLDTDNLDLRLQAQYVWSQHWRGSLSGGPSRVRTGSRQQSGSVFGATLTHQRERLTIDASLQRSIAPSGRGFLSRRDEAGLHLQSALLEHLDAVVDLRLIRSRDFVPQIGFTLNDVRYTQADLSLSWRFAKDWRLNVGAGSAEQKLMVNGMNGQNLTGRLQLAWRRATPAS